MEDKIDLSVDTIYTLDLKDDFLMNEDKDLYQLIDKDPVRAFHLGINICDWLNLLESKQKFLYSKQIRHNRDELEKYMDQMKFWTKKFSNDDEVELVELSEYILNNMFWDKETEESDKVKMAFFFGQSLKAQIDKQNE